MYKSETCKIRDSVLRFCEGNGVDIGAGGNKIKPSAINIDLEMPYACVGQDVVNLKGDARSLYWFKDGVLDYVYSSHLLEDFENKDEVLEEWKRVLKIGGNMILYLPDEQEYRKFCENTGQVRNLYHKDPLFSIKTVKEIAKRIGGLEIIFETGINIDYSFCIVFRRVLNA